MKNAKRTRANIFDLQPLEVRRFLTTASIQSGNSLVINGTDSAETITVNRLSSGRVSITGVATTFASGSSAGQFNDIVINANGGSDTIFISGNVGSSIPADINAGGGNDQITGGAGADDISGGTGFDTVNYSARAGTVRVDLDSDNDDGSSGEGDNVRSDVEEAIGGAGNDFFVGNGAGNYFAGGGGNDDFVAGSGDDELIGSTGRDTMFGEGDDDALYARNNDVDNINGGTGPNVPDLDLGQLDSIDVAANVGTSSSLVAARSILAAAAAAAAGLDPDALDSTYGPNETGINSSSVPAGWSAITAATVDSLGRVILVGYDDQQHEEFFNQDMVVTRYRANGTWDSDFGVVAVNFDSGGNGYGDDDDQAMGVTTDDQNRIIVVGSARQTGDEDFAIARISDGDTAPVIDFATAFNIPIPDAPEGGGSDVATDVAVQGDGSIVVVGTQDRSDQNPDFAIVRFTDLGDLDSSFNDGEGYVTVDIGFDEGAAVAIERLDGDTAIILGGTSDSDFVLARLGLDGSRTFDFGTEVDADTGASLGLTRFNYGSHAGGGDAFPTVDLLNDLMFNDQTGEIVVVGQSAPPGQFGAAALAPEPLSGAAGIIAAFDAGGTLGDFGAHSLDGAPVSFNAIAYDRETGTYGVAGSTGEDFVAAEFDESFTEFAADWDGLVVTDATPTPTNGDWRDTALGVGFDPATGKLVLGGYSETSSEGAYQTTVARYGNLVVEDTPYELDPSITDEDVQNDDGFDENGNQVRSETATNYLKWSVLDINGNALLNLGDGSEVVSIRQITNAHGVKLIAIDVDGLVCYYDPDPAVTKSITINGKGGNDRIVATDDILVPLIIRGGAGNDLVSGGGANDVVDGGDGFDVASGGKGNDVVLGGDGISAFAGLLDVVSGDAGDDIVIGGRGYDGVSGGSGSDIVIGGYTDYDDTAVASNLAALKAISAEWTTGAATRFANIRTGGGLTGGARFAAGVTVRDDNAADLLTGGSQRDWFFRRTTGSAAVRDSIVDNSNNEELDSL